MKKEDRPPGAGDFKIKLREQRCAAFIVFVEIDHIVATRTAAQAHEVHRVTNGSVAIIGSKSMASLAETLARFAASDPAGSKCVSATNGCQTDLRTRGGRDLIALAARNMP